MMCEPDFDFTRLSAFTTAGGQIQIFFLIEITLFELEFGFVLFKEFLEFIGRIQQTVPLFVIEGDGKRPKP